jgi:hypothetical protein
VVARYQVDCGQYPSNREALHALIVDQGVECWHGPYLAEVPLGLTQKQLHRLGEIV